MAKICFILNEFPILSETFIADQIEALEALGHEIIIIYNNFLKDQPVDLSHWKQKNIRLHHAFKLPNWLNEKLPHKIKRIAEFSLMSMSLILHARNCDAVIAHFGYMGENLTRYKKWNIMKAPLITFFHGFDVGVEYKKNKLERYKDLYKYGDLFITVNHHFKKLLIETGAQKSKVIVQPMGVDVDEIPFIKNKNTDHGIKIISVGRLVEKKGFLCAIKSINELKNKNISTNWHYEIIGNGPLHKEIEKYIKNNNLQDHITLAGALPHTEVKQKLKEAHIFLLPSITAPNGDVEGVPVALMEAMASGLITISSIHSGIPDLIEDQKTGFLSPENDHEDLGKKLEWAIQNYESCDTLLTDARHKVETDFNNEKLNTNLSNLITRMNK